MATDDPVREQTFPDHASTLAETDPELIEIFDGFAFDEVRQTSRLDARTRLMVQLAAITACRGASAFRGMLGAALAAGVTPVEIREVVYQAVPYIGMAKVFDVLTAANEEFRARGIALPLPAQASSTPETRTDVGQDVQTRIIGAERLAGLYANAPDDLQHIQRLLTANCFGDHVARGGIDLATRELLTVAMLAALGGCEPQLKGHVAANLRAGNDRARMIDVLTQILPFIGYPRTLNALRMVEEGTA